MAALAAYLTGKVPQPMTFEEIVLSSERTLGAQHSFLSRDDAVALEEYSYEVL
jgi:hypothetical protein